MNEKIGWGTLLRQMVRHRCGPSRAVEHELAWRYDEVRGYHLPLEVRAARARAIREPTDAQWAAYAEAERERLAGKEDHG